MSPHSPEDENYKMGSVGKVVLYLKKFKTMSSSWVREIASDSHCHEDNSIPKVLEQVYHAVLPVVFLLESQVTPVVPNPCGGKG